MKILTTNNQENTDLSYNFSPYTYARVSAMKGLLLKKNDYEKLLKLEINELIKFLQEGNYSNEINELAVKYKGLKLLEMALNKNLSKLLTKLRNIADIEIRPLVDLYLIRYDIYNIKTILRAKYSKINFEEIQDLLIPVSNLKYSFFKNVYQKSIKSILIESKIIPFSDIKEQVSKLENNLNEKGEDGDLSDILSDIENILDYNYYKNAIILASKIPNEGIIFKEFFEYEIDLYNLKLILKKILFNLEPKLIEKFIIYKGKKLSSKTLNLLLYSQNFESFLKNFQKTYYNKLLNLDNIDIQKLDIQKIEIIFENFLLKKRNLLSHQHPLSVDTILGFMFQKETEVKNLKVIIKSKSLNLEQDYYEKLILI